MAKGWYYVVGEVYILGGLKCTDGEGAVEARSLTFACGGGEPYVHPAVMKNVLVLLRTWEKG